MSWSVDSRMKYSTSPATSRCSSPGPHDSVSSLPTPITYRQNCMGATTKCYKYFRKLLKFEQMDFEFAIWQMLFLFISPQKVYRNFKSRKQTKSQFARDDPAFFVLVICFLSVSTVGLGILLGLSFVQFLRLFFYTIFIDFICDGLLVTTLLWFLANRYFRADKTQDVEWGYAFDINLNACFPPLVILYVVQFSLYHTVLSYDTFSARLIGNTVWLISNGYYIYITFLGYASVEILHKTHLILCPLPFLLLTYIVMLCANVNLSRLVMDFYYRRVL